MSRRLSLLLHVDHVDIVVSGKAIRPHPATTRVVREQALKEVSRKGFLPSVSAIHISGDPLRSEIHAIRLPSGE